MVNRIRELRKEKNLTMKQLGDKLGFSEVTISQYETGKREPNHESLIKFARFFNVTVGYLLCVENSEPYKEDQANELRNAAMKIFDNLSEADQDQAIKYLRFLAKDK